jgi:LysR family transcriptional regulator for bpeEF and oprC
LTARSVTPSAMSICGYASRKSGSAGGPGAAQLRELCLAHYRTPAPWEWQEGGATRSQPLRGRVTVNSAEAYIACCVAGLGLIQIPAYDVQAQIAAGELVEVMPDHRPGPMPMTLLYPQRRPPSRRVRVFADWLEALLKPACGLR